MPPAATFALPRPAPPAWSIALLPIGVFAGSAVLLLPFRLLVLGYLALGLSVGLAWLTDRVGGTSRLGPDLTSIAVGLAIVSSVSVAADISWGNFFLLGAVFAASAAAPYVLSRWVFRDCAVRYPWRGTWPWSPLQWGYLALVLVAGWLLLPFYFITTGVYMNWPAVHEWHEITRLFIGVNAVGTWDELFFICAVLAIFVRHVPLWQANILQTVVFVSFLWELGYQSWGPVLTIPFALLQGWLFTRTKSLAYVLTVHLLFDLIVFLVIVHARNDGAVPIFLL